ncbi:hypothetical protein ACW4EZ_30180 (plasmid) [Bacillus toyonensis]|uniref:hypothetical protein n=1 Tax=Bacillus TaxID=1386 RepID=UPI000BEC70F5|nr:MULTISPECIES: hypothetical protein [Bacillus]QPW51981.1 hypothetical protein G9298_30650 [Bacillus thuringiensis]AXK21616.1 hypothetical protein DPQ31_29605 [Bacillus sp. COPE52]PED94974.1 hypothetical protein CON90_10640 [Bacillus toyonensis]PEL58669.1 hypothetical protein CN633_15745 [Bacillus toyonensis]PEM82857.1 hypothetical protein CN639_23665 [Bacillus toyonensis]
MIEYIENNNSDKPQVNIYIGEDEWANYSFQNKVRLLYRLKNSDNLLAKQLVKSISSLIEEEQKMSEIDYEATVKQCEDTIEWFE